MVFTMACFSPVQSCQPTLQSQTPSQSPNPKDPIVKDTLDEKQKVFNDTNIHVLKRWRKALSVRYVHLLESTNSGFDVTWKDVDFDNNTIDRTDFSVRTRAAGIPNTLAKTFVQVKRAGVNYITVTLYYKRKRSMGGTCLIQGIRAEEWVKTEFHQLCALVRSLQNGNFNEDDVPPPTFSHLPLCSSCEPQHPPYPHQSSSSTAVCDFTSTEARDNRVVSNQTTSPFTVTPSFTSPTISPSASRGLLLDVSLADTPITPTRSTLTETSGVSLLMLIPKGDNMLRPISPQHLSSSADRVSFTATPPTDSACVVPVIAAVNDLQVSSPGMQTLLPATDFEISPSEAELHTVTLLPASRPASCPPEITNSSDPGMTQAAAHVTSMNTVLPLRHLAALPALQNSSQLYSRLHDALNIIAGLRADVDTLFKGLSAALVKIDQLDSHIRDEAVRRAKDLQATESCMGEMLSSLDERINSVESAQHAMDSTVNGLSTAKQNHKQRLRDLQKKLNKASAHTNSRSVTDNSDSTPTPLSAALDSSTSQRCAMDIETVASPLSAPPLLTQDDIMAVSLQAMRVGENESRECRIPVRITAGQPEIINQITEASGEQQQNNRPSHRLSPEEQILQHSVFADTNTLVIISVVHYIKAEKMSTYPEEKVQVISVSGLKTPHLIGWLRSQEPSHTVSLVTFHVGVNDCKQTEVTSAVWDQLARQCRRVFPSACIQASSILPAQRGQQLNRSITASNGNLYHMCKKRGVTFVDNTLIFSTKDGFPRKRLYRRSDPIHPSRQGTISLAINVKRGGVPPDTSTSTHAPSSGRDRGERRSGNSQGLYSEIVAGTASSTSTSYPGSQYDANSHHITRDCFNSTSQQQQRWACSAFVPSGLAEGRQAGHMLIQDMSPPQQQEAPDQQFVTMWQSPNILQFPTVPAMYPQYRAAPTDHFSGNTMAQPYPFNVTAPAHTPYTHHDVWAQYNRPACVY